MILPFETINYTTRFSADEAISQLKPAVGDSDWWGSSGKAFVGYVSSGDHSFRVHVRMGWGRRGFPIHMAGKLIPDEIGAKVTVKLWPDFISSAISVLILGFPFWTYFTRGDANSLIFTLIAGALLAGIYLYEVAEAENRLKEIIPPVLP